MAIEEPPTVQLSGKEKLVGSLLILTIVGLSMAFAFGPECARQSQHDELMRTGVDARATIMRLRDTGNTFNDQPEVELTLVVRLDGVEPYQVVVTQTLGPAELQRYRVEAELMVKVDPQDPRRVSIVDLAPAPAAPEAAAAVGETTPAVGESTPGAGEAP